MNRDRDRQIWAQFLLILIGMLACVAWSVGCATTSNKISVPADTVSFAPNAWVISFSPNMPTHPTTKGNGWYFDFPSQDGVHYVLVPYLVVAPVMAFG